MGIAFIFGLLFLYPLLADFDFSSNLVPLLFVGGFLAIFVAIGFTMVLNAILDISTSEPEGGGGRRPKDHPAEVEREILTHGLLLRYWRP